MHDGYLINRREMFVREILLSSLHVTYRALMYVP
jgi:hypothetical protein